MKADPGWQYARKYADKKRSLKGNSKRLMYFQCCCSYCYYCIVVVVVVGVVAVAADVMCQQHAAKKFKRRKIKLHLKKIKTK